MRNPSSPYYFWDPNCVGSLHRKHETRNDENPQPIYKSDIQRLWAFKKRNRADPLLQDYVTQIMDGTFKEPKGRPKDPTRLVKLLMADFLVEDEAKAISAQRKRDRSFVVGDFEPCVLAANRVGKWLGLAGGRSLLNAISNMKKGRI